MESFDTNNFLDQLKSDFIRVDKRINQFKDNFTHLVFLELRNFDKTFVLDNEMKLNLSILADEIWNGVDSVIYKDGSYPEFRLKEEVELMQNMVQRRKSDSNDQLSSLLHRHIKKMVVDEFQNIQELSAEGLRLLETYTWLYCIDFITRFQQPINEHGFQL